MKTTHLTLADLIAHAAASGADPSEVVLYIGSLDGQPVAAEHVGMSFRPGDRTREMVVYPRAR